MIIELKDTVLINVYRKTFEKKLEDGTTQEIEYFQALISTVGEPPLQFGVNKEDFEDLKKKIGSVGTALIDLDAEPGKKMRVRLIGIE